MGTPEKQTEFRRKRVAKACHSCRVLKSKCDGTRPMCRRCQGYGYQCVYSSGTPRRGRATAGGPGELHGILDEYGGLAEGLASKLPSAEEQASATLAISRLRLRANASLANMGASSAGPPTAVCISDEGRDDPSDVSPAKNHNERYLGEVSDVQFFNLVKRVLQIQGGSYPEQNVDSYEQDGGAETLGDATPGTAMEFPCPGNAKELMDVYFSTIHIAYPFIPETMFARHLGIGQSLPRNLVFENATQVALLYVICAIGAYYKSFPSNPAQSREIHEVYFQRAVSLTPVPGNDRSVDLVSLLLAQCFYFLATSRTDSCWTTLGQAIRTAQSIGLHVQSQSASSSLLSGERRSRMWYSMYVLDRLLALQLGRPPAIHDADCDVPLPSRVGDCDIDWEKGEMPSITQGSSSTGDYFLAVIAFSKIIGNVLRDLYSPGAAGKGQQANLYITKQLDRELTQWKSELPRALRFDLGHAFDQSLVYKRQRNMLAVKYHHLRTLIHRPYLSYPMLRDTETVGGTEEQTNWPVIGLYERICINEARAIARLFHNVSRQQDLVQDFPWWQMISCLICAGSILLVSSILAQPVDDGIDGLSAEALSDDAETCLRVLEALGANSTGARIARDMMDKLKEYGLRWRNVADSTEPLNNSQGPGLARDTEEHGVGSTQQLTAISGMENGCEGPSLPNISMPTPSQWPAEAVDSMTWSVQFFDAAHCGEWRV